VHISIPAPSGFIADEPIAGVEISHYRSIGVDVIDTYYLPESSRELFVERKAMFEKRGEVNLSNDVPEHLTVLAAPWIDNDRFDLIHNGVRKSGRIISAGWPWAYLRGEYTDANPAMTQRIAWDFDGGAVTWRNPGWVMLPAAAMFDEALPLHPMPLRLIAASILWSLPWICLRWMATLGMSLIKTRRTRNGCCQACGYRVGVVGQTRCPECGSDST
jgi:hypothetical protein